jgi:predicted enzyme related to lactoylglutathione lyase
MNRVVHFEFGAQDPARAVRFYEQVFGWTASKWAGPQEYWLVTTGPNDQPGINGGILKYPDGAARTVNTVEVESVDAACAKVTAGGQVVLPKMAVPGVGWLAYCTDTEGLIFGVHEPDPQAA